MDYHNSENNNAELSSEKWFFLFYILRRPEAVVKLGRSRVVFCGEATPPRWRQSDPVVRVSPRAACSSALLAVIVVGAPFAVLVAAWSATTAINICCCCVAWSEYIQKGRVLLVVWFSLGWLGLYKHPYEYTVIMLILLYYSFSAIRLSASWYLHLFDKVYYCT